MSTILQSNHGMNTNKRLRRVDGGIAAKVAAKGYENGSRAAKMAKAYMSEANHFRKRSEPPTRSKKRERSEPPI